MLRPMIRTIALAATLGLLAPFGCSSEREEPEEIGGQTPADYREQMEQGIAQPVGDSGAAATR